MQQQQRRASVLEIVGAWLHIWTPPRDTHIPPVPWRKLAIGAGLAVIVLGTAGAVFIPRLNAAKERRAAQELAEEKRAAAANRARIMRAQRPHRGEAAALLPASDATPAEQVSARENLNARVQADILADARDRAQRGEMRPVTGLITCERTPGSPTTGDLRVSDCFVVTRKIAASERNRAGALGYPFRVVVDYENYTYTWCKTEMLPGEMGVPSPKDVVFLPPECQAPKA